MRPHDPWAEGAPAFAPLGRDVYVTLGEIVRETPESVRVRRVYDNEGYSYVVREDDLTLA